MGSAISADEARERITSALDAIDAAHGLLRDTPSDVVGNRFRVDVAARLETQERVNRGVMYRIFAEIADPPDEAGSVAQMRSMLWKRLRITPNEISRRFKLAVRIRPRRSLTGPPLPPELPQLGSGRRGRRCRRRTHPIDMPSDRRAAGVRITRRHDCRRAHAGRACDQSRCGNRREVGSAHRRLPQSRRPVQRRGPGPSARAAPRPARARRHVAAVRLARPAGPRVLRSHRGRGAAGPSPA